jgi:anaphase-promoting complex subunit 6
MQAKSICSTDPVVYNELGVMAFRNKDYEAAARWLRKALSLAPPPLTEAWEPTVVNLAHTLRKLKYDMCDVSIFLPLYACMLKVSYV